MDYNDLMILLKQKDLQLEELCQKVDITADGLRKGIKNNSLALRYIKPLCNALNISPNEFIGWEEFNPTSGVYASNISGINTQNSNEAIKALHDQLKEKDKQINRLLAIIEKNKLK